MNLYKSFNSYKEMPNFNGPTGAYHGQLFCASARLSKPNEESNETLSPKGLLNGKLQLEKTCSTDMISDLTKERSFAQANSLIPSPEGISSLTMKEICSGNKTSGMNLLRNLDVASTDGNCCNCSSDSRNAGSCSVEDDGSIASRVLSLSSSCKSSSIFGSGGRSSGSSHEKSPKIRGVKFEYCTEGLGSESSDVNVSSLCHGEEQRETVPQSGKITLHGVEDDSNSSSGDLGENEDCTPRTNWPCGADRIKTVKCINNFPPPLSTLKRTSYPHHPNTPLVFLRPLRMDGRFVLQEVRVPCRDILRASRKDGRLRLELVTHFDEDNLSSSPHKAWEDDEKCSDPSLKEGEDETEECLTMEKEKDARMTADETNVKVEGKSLEEIEKDHISFPTSHKSNPKEIGEIVQGGRYPMSERNNPEEKEGMLQEAMLCDNLKSVSLVGDDQNLLKVSGAVAADKVERNMPKKQKQQDFSISCDIDLGENVRTSSSMHSMSQETVEQKKILGPALITGEDNGSADFSSLGSGLEPMELELMNYQLQQQELLRGEERQEDHPETPPTTKISSTAFGTITLESSDEKRYTGQGDITNDLTPRAGVDDPCTKFSEPHSMPVLSPSPPMLPSSFPDLQLSLTRMQAAIISNAEAFHSCCKKGLDGNDWKKGVAPFVGVPLRC